MTTMNIQPELSELDPLTLLRRMSELQRKARPYIEEMELIRGEIDRKDQERVRPL